MNPEKVMHHVSHLEEKLDVLKKQVSELERTGIYDDKEIHLLKKQKLLLKDEIERLTKSIPKP